jgi:hypothetical protein
MSTNKQFRANVFLLVVLTFIDVLLFISRIPELCAIGVILTIILIAGYYKLLEE